MLSMLTTHLTLTAQVTIMYTSFSYLATVVWNPLLRRIPDDLINYTALPNDVVKANNFHAYEPPPFPVSNVVLVLKKSQKLLVL
jgi:hypothetical protein